MFKLMEEQTHILIAGCSGAGKSVVLNDFLIWLHNRSDARYILIDLKRVELSAYRRRRDTIAYADDIETALQALGDAVTLIEKRYKKMQRKRLKKSEDPAVYIVIDELGDLMTIAKKRITPLIQRISQIGRAAAVHIVACTQCPLSAVIPTQIKVNFDCVVGLRTRSKRDSTNIGIKNLEQLPLYGYAIISAPQLLEPELYQVPMWTESPESWGAEAQERPENEAPKRGILQMLQRHLKLNASR